SVPFVLVTVQASTATYSLSLHDALPIYMAQRRLDQREGDAGIGRLAPAEAEAFPQQAHDLGDAGIGIGIGGAAADHHQRGLMARDRKSTRLNSSHVKISYAVFCLKKKMG